MNVKTQLLRSLMLTTTTLRSPSFGRRVGPQTRIRRLRPCRASLKFLPALRISPALSDFSNSSLLAPLVPRSQYPLFARSANKG